MTWRDPMDNSWLQVERRAAGRGVITRDGVSITLRTATEHYGAVLNGAFDYHDYLSLLRDSGCNLTRTFVLFRELQSATNPSSTCKPESLDYIAPYPRVAAGVAEVRALDGQPKYDLDAWNPRFFDRLHDFCAAAESVGVIVELTILSNTYGEPVWQLNPLHPDNHLHAPGSEPGIIEWPEYLSERHAWLLARQEDLVRKIVDECADHPNVIFELCNEPGGNAPVSDGADPVTLAEVNSWLRRLTAVIRDVDGGRHLVAGQPAFRYQPWEQSVDLALRPGPEGDLVDVDIVNVHPLPGTVIAGRSHELGRFMSGDLAADELDRFCRAAAGCGKPVNLDEDNAATQYTNLFGWTVHRKRAWIAALNGCHYDMIDFTIRPRVPIDYLSRLPLRDWTRFLGACCDTWPLATGVREDGWSVADPRCRVITTRVGPRDARDAEPSWVTYLLDASETTSWADPLAPIDVDLQTTLGPGRYRLRLLNPADGSQQGLTELDLPASGTIPALTFRDDLLVVIEPVRSAS